MLLEIVVLDDWHEYGPTGQMDNRGEGNDTGEKMSVLDQGNWKRDELGDVLRCLNGFHGVYVV